jgi:hypothetical protein
LHTIWPQSAALGLAMAGAVHLGYANIFVTAPSPENLKTLFQFVLKVTRLLFEWVWCVCHLARLSLSLQLMHVLLPKCWSLFLAETFGEKRWPGFAHHLIAPQLFKHPAH